MAQYIDSLISVLTGLYALLLGLGAPLPPQKFKGKKPAAILGALIILGGVAALLSRSGIVPAIPADARPVVLAMKKKLSLPAEVDNMTRLDDVKAEGEKVVYVMTILKPREEALDRAVFMNGYLPDQACKSENYLKLLNAGLWVVIIYRDLDGEPLQTITIQPKDCKPPAP